MSLSKPNLLKPTGEKRKLGLIRDAAQGAQRLGGFL
jgi:hypothetical protein